MGHATLRFDALLHRPGGQASERATGSASWRTALLTGLLLAGAAAPEARSQEGELPFDVASLFFELNDTDGDLGIHALIDGEPWSVLEIEDPDEHVILFVRGTGHLAQQGLTELFFESAEPPFDELAPEEFFERFPEGLYEISGRTLEGDELESTDQLTHVLPAAPDNITVNGQAVGDCDEQGLPVVNGPIVVSFDAVTQSHPDLGVSDPDIEIAGYEVVVEREEPTVLAFNVDLPPSEAQVQQVQVPPEFIALGTAFKLEILVREASGNQTAVESCFEVE
jgi:hypothetical protein